MAQDMNLHFAPGCQAAIVPDLGRAAIDIAFRHGKSSLQKMAAALC
jgi:hypothetical protein